MRQVRNFYIALVAVVVLLTEVRGWSPQVSSLATPSTVPQSSRVVMSLSDSETNENGSLPTRRSFVSSVVGAAAIVASGVNKVANAAEEEDFGSIAARAAKISKAMDEEEEKEESVSKPKKSADSRTVYDFSLPVAGKPTTFADLIHQERDGETGASKVKAVLVVNIKQDDPIARKNIPEMISLAAKYGRNGEFAVVACPTDQGYYEPDTSALIRLKMASEYGYAINPAAILTDKVNLLGSGAHPFWRWLEGTCRTPDGLGKIQANFEKFLIDGETGLPLRRYPRKYQPFDIQSDIEAVIAGKRLPPAGSNFREEWRTAAADAERDTYRFQKGLNYFDQ